jgi:hypothetical protein
MLLAESASLRERLERTSTHAAAKEELRSRIVEIVERLGETFDLAIWQASAPDFLPWDPMLRELRALHTDGKLVLDIRAPGCWIVRPLSQNGKARRKAAAPRAKKKQ